MFDVLLQMGFLVVCGVVWRYAKPGGLDVDQIRSALTGLVYYLLLPALVMSVLWRAPLSLDTPRIALVAAFAVIAALLFSSLACRLCRTQKMASGAVILAASFPNATYLGLPVLDAVLGETGRSIAIQYDLFACTPLLLTVGMVLAQRYGTTGAQQSPLRSLLKVPPLWAALIAVVLNLAQVPFPKVIDNWLTLMGGAVSPLMLIALGLSLRFDALRMTSMMPVVTVALIQLLLMPLCGWGMAYTLGLSGDLLVGVLLEAAMPSMVLGLVICDRFGLDTSLYAAAVTATTALSFITLPVWFSLL